LVSDVRVDVIESVIMTDTIADALNATSMA